MKNLLQSSLFLLILCLAAAGEVVTYPTPAGITSSSEYIVTANRQPVFVHQMPVASCASFDFTEKVDIVIRTGRDVKWADVRPKSLGIRPGFSGHEIRFSLDRPCALSVELNGEFSNNPLFLFANETESAKPDPADPQVRFFEGGKVHQAGIIEVTSGETVYIEGGAIVQGAILAENAENITIKGRGILDGTRHREWTAGRARGQRFVDLRHCRNVTVEGIILSNSQSWQVVPTDCDEVNIRNIKIVSDNPSDDGIDVVSSRNVLIERCFIRTKDDNIAVKAFYKRNPDDVNEPAVDVDGVLAQNNVFWNAAWGNALEIGFELRSRFVRNVVFRDSDIIHVEDGAALSIHNGDSATVENVTFEDIRIEDARQKLFDIAIFLSRYSVDAPKDRSEQDRRYMNGAWDGVLAVPSDRHAEHAQHRGQVRRIRFKNISIVDGLLPFSVLAGFDEEHALENITFDNITVRGKKITNAENGKFYLENVKNVEIK